MYKPRNRRGRPAYVGYSCHCPIGVRAEETYEKFKTAEKRTEDLRKAWMDAYADANYESVNGLEDCLERVLRKYPNKIESIDFLEEIDTYRRLSDSRKTLVKNKIFNDALLNRREPPFLSEAIEEWIKIIKDKYNYERYCRAKVVAEEAYKEFKIAEERTEDLRLEWMDAHERYEITRHIHRI
jgi:hypothetical protein